VINNIDHRPAILVLNDVEETRDGIQGLLTADGYHVDPARNEEDAVEIATRRPPDLILVSLDGPPIDVVSSAARIRPRAGLSEAVPVVVFCTSMIEEGAEVVIGNNFYATRPDNFDQLRNLLRRLLMASTWSQ
jgi:CheY-like chemotaxis protein